MELKERITSDLYLYEVGYEYELHCDRLNELVLGEGGGIFRKTASQHALDIPKMILQLKCLE